MHVIQTQEQPKVKKKKEKKFSKITTQIRRKRSDEIESRLISTKFLGVEGLNQGKGDGFVILITQPRLFKGRRRGNFHQKSVM